MALSGIAAFVERQRRRHAEARAAQERFHQMVFEHEIESLLGTVTVDHWGTLLEVRLDRSGLRAADPRTVAPRVLKAIHAAETCATRAMDEHLRSGR